MRKRNPNVFAVSILAGAMAVTGAVTLLAQSQKSAPPANMPKVGDVAPDLKLQYFDGKELKDVTLSQYRGKKNVVLAFYIFAFTGG
jgi:type VI protein secretion system component Hcp